MRFGAALRAILSGLFVLQATLGFAQTGGVTRSAEVRRLISLAQDKGERELHLSWGNSLGGIAGAKKLEEMFNRMYGTNIKVNFTPGPSMPEIAAKLTQEVIAGQKASTDLFLGTETHFSAFVNRDVLESYDYTRLSPRITRQVVAPQNIGVQIRTHAPVIVYNTNWVAPAEVPRKLEDVLNAKWKGKIASTAVAAYFDRVAFRPEWGPEKMKTFVRKLSEHVSGLIRVSESSRIVSGEFVMLVLGSPDVAFAEISKGAPLGAIVPMDAVIMAVDYIGVPRNSAHSNLSKLFVHMMITEEGQAFLHQTTYSDHFALPGSKTGGQVKDFKSKGIDPLVADIRFHVDHPEIMSLQADLRKILREKQGN
jgi:ABC-type Fe3+ transport system substrate-binding protein